MAREMLILRLLGPQLALLMIGVLRKMEKRLQMVPELLGQLTIKAVRQTLTLVNTP